MAERLYRSRKSKILGGVCGGIADYFRVDPVIVRILWIVLCLFSLGIGIIVYLVCWVIIPLEPEEAVDVSAREVREETGEETKAKEAESAGEARKEEKKGDGGLLVIGSFFVCLGFLWMIAEQFHVGNFGGMAAILVGLTIIIYWIVERR
jgi:phage shock protein PspC (stress-responsive transcriptional regulator)